MRNAADVNDDEAAADQVDKMQKGITSTRSARANPADAKRSLGLRGGQTAPATKSRTAPAASPAAMKSTSDSLVIEDGVVDNCPMEADSPAPAAPAPAPAAPSSPAAKKQKTASKRPTARKSAAAAAKSDDEGADAADADADAAAAAAAAADAATFSTEEATQINTALQSWYDRVMRILPWRRNPHHKPQQQQQQQNSQTDAAPSDTQPSLPAPTTAAATAAAAVNGSDKEQQQQKQTQKQKKKPSKAEVAAAEAAAVVAAAKPAPADLSPQQFAYYVWVSEIMLQQTQVARVITYFNNWIAAWPTVQDLAGATQEQVNEVWAGLGYYRRARYLLEGAQYVVGKLEGRFPETAEGMRQIPGVGPYTAAAVASIAFNDAAAAVDGNIIRVISRLRALKGNPTKMSKTFDRLAAQLLHTDRPGCHNQAMMELGATVCKPVNPLCDTCPVSSCCAAYKQVCEYAAAGGSPDLEDAPRVTGYPEKVAKAAKHEQHVAVCVLKVLLLPGINTPQELAAAAAAAAAAGAGSSGSNAAKKATKAGSAAATDSKQGNIRSFFKPAAKPAAAGGAGGAAGGVGGSSEGSNSRQQQQVVVCEEDVLAAGGVAHYLLVQRPPTGLLAGLWEFPGVVIDFEPTPKARRAAVDNYLSSSLGVQGLMTQQQQQQQQQSTIATAAGAAGVQVLHRRQLGSAVHIFSHIRQTMHAEELVLLAPSLSAVCPAAAAAADSGGPGSSSKAAAATGGGSRQKKRKAGAGGKTGGGAAAAGDDDEDDGGGEEAAAEAATAGGSSGGMPCMRWVAAAGITQQGLTSGVRKVLQLSLK